MEEVSKHTTRKRKQYPPQNPLGGIFTRQKSQIFFHSTRSGKSRPDPVRKRGSFPQNRRTKIDSQMGQSQIQNPPPNVVEEQNPNHGDDDDEEIYNISIKDLRARRVFSKPAQLKKVGVVQSGKVLNPNPNLHSDGKMEKFGDESSGVEIEKSAEETRSNLVGKCDFAVDLKIASCENPNLSKCELNPNLNSEMSDGKFGDGSESGGVEKSGEEIRSGEGLVEEKCDIGTDLKITSCENPNLSMPEKCEFGDFMEDGSNCRNPYLLDEGCDKVVDFRGDESNGENPNLLVGSIEASDANGGVVLDGAKEGNFEMGLDCNGKSSDHLSPNLSRIDLKGLNGGICEGLNEENVQATPPDAVIHVQQSDEGNGSSALQNRNVSSSSPVKKVSPTKAKKNLSDSRKNMVLKPCSRMKLFKTPNSFSYRRLLPYLLDMEKDAKDTITSALKPTPPVKTEPDAGENSVVSLTEDSIIDAPKLDENPPTIPPCLPQETSTKSTNAKEVEKACSVAKLGDLATVESAIEIPVNCSQDKTQVNPQEISPTVDNDSLGTSLCEQTALIGIGTPQDISLTFETNGTPETPQKDTNSEPPCQLSVYAERECKTSHLELKTNETSITLFQSTAKLEAVVSPGVSLAKGILKRNPRGCRGVCNCLDCSSFRLNAGRAFEFSRNQMLDAEELVLNLRKELSNVRVLLEKSTHSGNNQAILPADEVQEACKRVASMEDIAANRITQMNEDLYIHCRTKPLKRPRVNFSSNMEEKFIIGKSSKQTNQNDDASRSLQL